MKTRVSYQWMVVMVAWCVMTASMKVSGADPDPTDNFKVVLTPEQTKIFPFEPAYLKYSFSNNSDSQQTITGQWHVAVYLRKDEVGEWENYEQPRKFQAAPPVPRPRIFAAGEKLEGVLVLDVNFNGKHVFVKPGAYRVKVKLAGLESVPVLVTVQPPPNEDNLACRYLEDHPLYRFFTEWMANQSLDSLHGKEPVEELDKVIRQFSSSRYAQWARLGLLWVKKARAGDDRAAVEVLRRDMEKEAPALAAPMNAMAWYEAGVAAYRLGDDVGADTNFKQAIAVGERVFATEQVARFKRGETYTQRLKSKDKRDDQLPVKKPVEVQDRKDVEVALRRFMAAHREGRIEECAGMMTEDFVRGRMDRTKSLAKMQKEFEKLKGKKLDAEPTFDSVTTDGTNVTVAISVVYRLAGEQRSQKESYTLRQEQGQWKISRQAVTYSEPPPGFPPHPPAPPK